MIHTAPQLPKFRVLLRHLRPFVTGAPVDPETIVTGLLERLWHVTATGAPRGDIGRLSDEVIAEMVGWHGDAEVLINALVASGWLDDDDEHRLVVHDYHEHAPRFVKGVAAKKGGFVTQDLRTRSLGRGPKDGDLRSPTEVPQDADPGTPTPNLTKPNLTINEASASSAEVLSAPSTAEEPPLMRFPVVGGKSDDAGDWGLTPSLVTELQGLFPDLDIQSACRSALAWILADPKRRKTRRGMRKFLTGWLERSQNRGDARAGPGPHKSRGEAALENFLSYGGDGGEQGDGRLGGHDAARSVGPPTQRGDVPGVPRDAGGSLRLAGPAGDSEVDARPG